MGQDWLYFPAAEGYVDIGILDVTGTQLTVEALYSSTNNSSVDLVSKHSDPSNVNYLLRRTHAELTTASGFGTTPAVCGPELNTCHHAAMVYDGTNLYFYLNGQLNGQVPMSGNLATNGFQTLIGNVGCCFAGEQFYGYINEVRIWNVARTQADIQTYMFAPLPTPPSQIGLMAYYNFNSLVNLQGNPAFNGTLSGTGMIGQSNPFCGTLSPVCAILGPQFSKFTYARSGEGLDFDWIWEGENPLRFELETGPSPEALSYAGNLDGGSRSYRVQGLPVRNTWYRMRAVTMNGEAVLSNAVQFRGVEAEGFEVQVVGDVAKVNLVRPMALGWVLRDLRGVKIDGGSLAAGGNVVEIPLPETAAGVVLLEVVGDGVRRVERVWRAGK